MNNRTIEKAKSGAGTPELKAIKINSKLINNFNINHTAKINDKIQKRAEFIQKGIQNKFNIILHDSNSKKPNWLGMKASDYEADLQTLLTEYMKNPYGYGYGVVVGKQLGDFYLIAIDMDIDTEECKERISKELEELLNKHGIRYYKEITKNKRIHFKIVLDKTTDKIESITKLPYPGTCFKHKDDKELPGEIELFTKKNKFIIVYDGIINDKEPFFTQKPEINSYQAFENFLTEWLSKYETAEGKKEPESNSKTSIQLSELKEVFKIFRKHRLFN
ncbi:MAG: hypothetical protein JHC31_05220, partial [Sulfurihydrogenibium sp.]|nr:hypothetical protein [Sulfurihydrogenibium sp.]